MNEKIVSYIQIKLLPIDGPEITLLTTLFDKDDNVIESWTRSLEKYWTVSIMFPGDGEKE